MLGPTEPRFYERDADSIISERLLCVFSNYVNHPSLLSATPQNMNALWTSTPCLWIDPYATYDSTEHFSQTILASDPDYPELFQKSRMDQYEMNPAFHHVTFTISTRIVDRPEGRAHQIAISAVTFDAENKKGPGHIYFNPDGWAEDINYNARVADDTEILPVIRDIFLDWKCVVEYLKYGVRCANDPDDEGRIHPLIHMGIPGSGETFKRAELRLGVPSLVLGVGNGSMQVIENTSGWQEFKDGRWQDVNERTPN